jgi:hypothetical protein
MDPHLLVAFREPAAVAVTLERRRPQLVVVGVAVAGEEPIVAA